MGKCMSEYLKCGAWKVIKSLKHIIPPTHGNKTHLANCKQLKRVKHCKRSFRFINQTPAKNTSDHKSIACLYGSQR